MNQNSKLDIYPNPTNGNISITNSNSINSTIEIINRMGEIEKKYKPPFDQLNISELENGVYFLKINNAMYKIILIK